MPAFDRHYANQHRPEVAGELLWSSGQRAASSPFRSLKLANRELSEFIKDCLTIDADSSEASDGSEIIEFSGEGRYFIFYSGLRHDKRDKFARKIPFMVPLEEDRGKHLGGQVRKAVESAASTYGQSCWVWVECRRSPDGAKVDTEKFWQDVDSEDREAQSATLETSAAMILREAGNLIRMQNEHIDGLQNQIGYKDQFAFKLLERAVKAESAAEEESSSAEWGAKAEIVSAIAKEVGPFAREFLKYAKWSDEEESDESMEPRDRFEKHATRTQSSLNEILEAIEEDSDCVSEEELKTLAAGMLNFMAHLKAILKSKEERG